MEKAQKSCSECSTLLFSGLFLTVYFFLSTILYPFLLRNMENYFEYETVYFVLYFLHAGMILVGSLIHWIGYFKNRKRLILAADLIAILGGLTIYPAVVMMTGLFFVDFRVIHQNKKK